MDSWKVSRLIALASLVASTSAFGSFSAPHYLGVSRAQGEFRMYLGGGKFLGRTGSLQAVGVSVHQLRKGHPPKAIEGCVYRFDAMNWRKDRIECADSTPAPLRGVEYARSPTPGEKGSHAPDLMVCVRRCDGQAPQRLRLQEADEDNG